MHGKCHVIEKYVQKMSMSLRNSMCPLYMAFRFRFTFISFILWWVLRILVDNKFAEVKIYFKK